MPYATLNLQGEIKSTYTKPNPLVRLRPDERMVRYDPPDVDLAYYTVTPVTPVIGKSVEFIVEEKVDLKKENYLAKVDRDVDKIYQAVIGNREPEYRQAENEALEFKAAGFEGPVPSMVKSYSMADGITTQQAAESILQKSEDWRQASSMIRSARLAAKAAIRAGDFDTFTASWLPFLSAIQTALAITITPETY